MKIAVTVDPYIPIPPEYYGGIERVVDFLVRGLRGRGHEVTLFAHPESRVESALVPYGAPPHVGRMARARELWQVGSRLYRLRDKIDLVHSFGRLAALLPVLPKRSLPKVQTYQRDVLPRQGIRRAVALAGPSLELTACATHMYSNQSFAGDWTTVFNGVDLDKYSFAPTVAPDAPLVFLGRVERIKGTHNAIAIAKAAGRRLLIAGNITDRSYFDSVVAPEIDDETILYVGPVDDAQKNDLLSRAAALLMAIEWEEPFGIVMVEAMACGTPIIGFARGAVSEVVRDGVNGFIVRDVHEAAAAVQKLPTLQRAGVRRDAEQRFSADVIVSDYERLYERMVTSLR